MQRTGLLAGFFAFVAGIAGCANNGAETCDPACSAFQRCCGGATGVTCRDIVNDPSNCGGCGIVCPSGVCREAACVTGPPPSDGGMPGADSGGGGGDCRPTCGSTERCCGTTCVSRNGVALGSDGRSNPSFTACNGCGIACDMDRASACSVPGGGMGTPRCMCGSLDQCRAGELCVNQAGSFTCVSTQNDPRNCGAPGNMCATGESCVGGVCQCAATGSACGAGNGCCPSGCVDLQNDVNNCGACGTRCGTNEACTAGMCTCNGAVCARPTAGVFGIGGSCGEVCCETGCVAASATNCGACGVTCGEGQICGTPFDLGGIGGGGMSMPMPPSCLPAEGGIFPPTECGAGGGGFPLPFP